MPQERKIFIRPPSTAGAKPLPQGPAKRPLGQDKLSDAGEILQGLLGLGFDPVFEGPEAAAELSDAAKIGSVGMMLPWGRGKSALMQLLKRAGVKIPEAAAVPKALTQLEQAMAKRKPVLDIPKGEPVAAPPLTIRERIANFVEPKTDPLETKIYPDPDAFFETPGHSSPQPPKERGAILGLPKKSVIGMKPKGSQPYMQAPSHTTLGKDTIPDEMEPFIDAQGENLALLTRHDPPVRPGTHQIPPDGARERAQLMHGLMDEGPLKDAWGEMLKTHPRTMGHVQMVRFGDDAVKNLDRNAFDAQQGSVYNHLRNEDPDYIPKDQPYFSHDIDDRLSVIDIPGGKYPEPISYEATDNLVDRSATDAYNAENRELIKNRTKRLLAHELTHVGQQLRRGDKFYDAYDYGNRFGYDFNPYEVNARQAELNSVISPAERKVRRQSTREAIQEGDYLRYLVNGKNMSHRETTDLFTLNRNNPAKQAMAREFQKKVQERNGIVKPSTGDEQFAIRPDMAIDLGPKSYNPQPLPSLAGDADNAPIHDPIALMRLRDEANGAPFVNPENAGEVTRLMMGLLNPEDKGEMAVKAVMEKYPNVWGNAVNSFSMGDDAARNVFDNHGPLKGMYIGGDQGSVARTSAVEGTITNMPHAQNRSHLNIRTKNRDDANVQQTAAHELLHAKDQLKLGKEHERQYQQFREGPRDQNPFEVRADKQGVSTMEKLQAPSLVKKDRIAKRLNVFDNIDQHGRRKPGSNAPSEHVLLEKDSLNLSTGEYLGNWRNPYGKPETDSEIRQRLIIDADAIKRNKRKK